MRRKTQLLLFSCWFFVAPLIAEPYFKVVVLGCMGGPLETNMPGYLLAPILSEQYIALDTGSLVAGIEIGVEKGSFPHLQLENNKNSYEAAAQILRNHIKAYLISHPHLDHTMGLVINSPIDTKTILMGTNFTIDAFRDHIFNGIIWPNFGSEGTNPLDIYQYERLKPQTTTGIPGTQMSVQIFSLHHPGCYESTAFLVESNGHYTLYIGDTSPDSLEKTPKLEPIWREIAPLIQKGALHGIFIECSYDNSRPKNQLYGHLTPQYVLEELDKLAQFVNPGKPTLGDTKILINHIKQTFLKNNDAPQKIKEELEGGNRYNFQFILLEQGLKYEL